MYGDLKSKPQEELEKTKQLLEKILAIEASEDSELKADLEGMKTLLIFKKAKALLNRMEEQIQDMTFLNLSLIHI